MYKQEKTGEEKKEKLDILIQWLPGIGVILSVLMQRYISGLREHQMTGAIHITWLALSMALGSAVAWALLHVCRKAINRNSALSVPATKEESDRAAGTIKNANRVFIAGDCILAIGMIIIPMIARERANTFLICVYWLFPFAAIVMLVLFDPWRRARALKEWKNNSKNRHM